MSHFLTTGLPEFASGAERAETVGHATPPDDLSPISAALAAYDGIIAYGQREWG